MTSLQLEPSAHAPCTKTTLCASAVLAPCARLCPEPNVVKSSATATASPFTSIPIALLVIAALNVRRKSTRPSPLGVCRDSGRQAELEGGAAPAAVAGPQAAAMRLDDGATD